METAKVVLCRVFFGLAQKFCFFGVERKSPSPSVDPLILQDAGNMTQLKWVVKLVTSE